MTMTSIDHLEPSIVWKHFAMLCATPRPSKHEAALRANLIRWAKERSLAVIEDAAGNLIVRKPATPGAEHCPGVVLQGHLDMVCQKNAGIAHDFLTDPIRPQLVDGWLVAPHTTLGADNGIGVALALAALESDDLAHPALEVLLTVDEEAGMGGVRGVMPGTLRGAHLINLDTEEWGKLYIGCAGGLDVRVRQIVRTEAAGDDLDHWNITVSGLQGGHSGIDIHRGRGNAIKLLVEWLAEAAKLPGVRISTLHGGTARNALPREAFATVCAPAEHAQALHDLTARLQADWQARLRGIDDGVRACLQASDTLPTRLLGDGEQTRLLSFLAQAPHGVRADSREFPGVVETSNNLGVVSFQDGALEAVFMVRSLKREAFAALADEIVALARKHGADAEKIGVYPAWTPDPASPLLARFQQVYAREFGAPAQTEIIHAGLECGLLSASHPALQMISFGPDIRGAHAPGERVEVASVGKCWQLLRAVLNDLAAVT